MTALISRADIPDISLDAVDQLAQALGEDVEVTTRALDRITVSADASHYMAIPDCLARPKTAAQVGAAMAIARRCNWPLTLRGGGTSLSGQALSEGLTLDVRRHFRNMEVLDQGKRVRVEPGLTVGQVNNALAPLGRKLGPDPASTVACTIGGMIANNSSGMTCGVTANTYKTLESLVIVLPSGTVIDTGAADADAQLEQAEPELVTILTKLRDQLRAPATKADIQRRYSMKNTMGYGLNSFIDFDRPVKILEHLMVGSEGTLGFIASAILRTVPILPKTATGLLIFPHLNAATAALRPLVDSGADVVELIDSAAIEAMGEEGKVVLPAGFSVSEQAALLVEYQGYTDDDMAQASERAQAVFAGLDLEMDAEMTSDPKRRTDMWVMRQGLYTKVAGNRPTGTVALLEDIAVPMDRLGSVCSDLHVLFDRHNYEGAVIFGHAKDGNIHFLVTEDFDGDAAIKRYEEFTEDMVDLILSEQGTLKAEHGTGRIMAPYVKRQYGEELYDAMWQVKRACDPTMALNPGSVLTEDDKIHLRNIKQTPGVTPLIDRCVECGYCEPVCPAQHLTTTPRQRIVVTRAIEEAKRTGKTELARELYRDSTYSVVQTCAVDGMCETACPLKINTGDLIREVRAERANPALQVFWDVAARGWAPFGSAAGVAMSAFKKVPAPFIAATKLGRAVLGDDTVPLLSRDLPGGGVKRQGMRAAKKTFVYMPACIGTMFGSEHTSMSGVQEAFFDLTRFAGIDVEIPDGIRGLCCATPWKSKGMTKGGDRMGRRLADILGEASDGWKLPIVCDNISCTEGLAVALHKKGIEAQIVDATAFVAEHIAPALPQLPRAGLAVVHPTCSSTRAGTNDALIMLAGMVADEVKVPLGWRCCGFAGDRGMLHPELTAMATSDEAYNVKQMDADLYLSCNRTCEIGMTRATGHTYVHVLEELAARLRQTTKR